MERIKKKAILLTGANGFIGKNIIEQLDSHYDFLTPSHKELDLLKESKVNDYFATHHIDTVIHCAVAGGSQKAEYKEYALHTNIRMFFNIVRNQHQFKRMIHLGSGAEYNKGYPIIKVKESDFDRTIPTDDYGIFKYICSKYIEYSNKIVNLRVFGVYGKYEDYSLRFISQSLCKYLFKLPIQINQNVFFEYVYINDLITIIDYCIKHKPKRKVYNIGRNQKIDLKTIAQKINQLDSHSVTIKINKPGLNKEYTCDNTQLVKDIPNLKFTDFDQSLRELYRWYKKNTNMLQKSKLQTKS